MRLTAAAAASRAALIGSVEVSVSGRTKRSSRRVGVAVAPWRRRFRQETIRVSFRRRTRPRPSSRSLGPTSEAGQSPARSRMAA